MAKNSDGSWNVFHESIQDRDISISYITSAGSKNAWEGSKLSK
jgi:hypothetical protein